MVNGSSKIKSFKQNKELTDQSQPFRLAPVSERPEFSCPDCFSPLTENFNHDLTTGRHFDCSHCNKTMIPEAHTRKESNTIALGSTSEKYSKANTSFVAVSSNHRVVTAGPRSNPNLAKESRTFSRNHVNGYSGEDPGDHRLPNGDLDSDLVHYASVGIITNISNSLENEE
jgi:hypothetical protein